jgi:hypothetical protein
MKKIVVDASVAIKRFLPAPPAASLLASYVRLVEDQI